MKLKVKQLINIGLYEHLEVEHELEVPDELKNEELITYLHKRFKKVMTPDEDTNEGKFEQKRSVEDINEELQK